MDCPTTSAASQMTRCRTVAFLGLHDAGVLGSVAKQVGARTLGLASEQATGWDGVNSLVPFRQEDAERALQGVSAIVLGLPVPLPRAAMAQGTARDAQAFAVDGLMAAAQVLGIRHVAVVASERPSVGASILDEVGRIVRAYGVDVLEVAEGNADLVRAAAVRWLGRCGSQGDGKPPMLRPQDLLGRKPSKGRNMRSLQRLSVPKGWDAARLALAYPTWLGATFPWLLRTEIGGDGSFLIRSSLTGTALLDLRAVPRSHGARRRVFSVAGGALAGEREGEGWLEFRVLPGGKEAIAAVGDFVPRLPWQLYRGTQGPMHQRVMAGFARYLGQTTT
jgi:hypothetical protein